MEGCQPAGRDAARQLVGGISGTGAERAGSSAEHQQPEHQAVFRAVYGSAGADCGSKVAVLADDYGKPRVEPIAKLVEPDEFSNGQYWADQHYMVRTPGGFLGSGPVGQDTQRGAGSRVRGAGERCGSGEREADGAGVAG